MIRISENVHFFARPSLLSQDLTPGNKGDTFDSLNYIIRSVMT